MFFKTTFVLLACAYVVLGFSIESSIQKPAGLSSLGSSSDTKNQGSEALSSAQKVGSKVASNISSGVQNAGKKLQTAFNNTYQEEKNSVSDSWNNVKELIHQNVETHANLTKTAFDLGTIIPKFGKNLIISK